MSGRARAGLCEEEKRGPAVEHGAWRPEPAPARKAWMRRLCRMRLERARPSWVRGEEEQRASAFCCCAGRQGGAVMVVEEVQSSLNAFRHLLDAARSAASARATALRSTLSSGSVRSPRNAGRRSENATRFQSTPSATACAAVVPPAHTGRSMAAPPRAAMAAVASRDAAISESSAAHAGSTDATPEPDSSARGCPGGGWRRPCVMLVLRRASPPPAPADPWQQSADAMAVDVDAGERGIKDSGE